MFITNYILFLVKFSNDVNLFKCLIFYKNGFLDSQFIIIIILFYKYDI